MQELDAARRAAILRGQTPPPLPEETNNKDVAHGSHRGRDERGHVRKRRKLAGEDDTDMDIRLAKAANAPENGVLEDAKVLKLRGKANDAPLTDHAGHIDLFPVDMKEAMKREKNVEVEAEKRKKERALEDQYTMRFSNAAGREGLSKPWYAAEHKLRPETEESTALAGYGSEGKDVWGNEDPRRKQREQARITSNDPFAFMQKAQAQLKRSKEDKKKWVKERDRELRELRATQEREDRKSRHYKRRRGDDGSVDRHELGRKVHDTSPKERRRRSRSRSRDRHRKRSSHRHERRHGSESRDRSRGDEDWATKHQRQEGSRHGPGSYDRDRRPDHDKSDGHKM